MTPEDIAKARALVEAATPGPWEEYDAPCCPDMGGVSGPIGSVCASQVGRYGHPQKLADAAFIAASRSLVPQLLDEVDRLTDALVRKDEDWQELFAELARLRPVYEAAKAWHVQQTFADDGVLSAAIDAAIAEESKP